MKFGIYLKSSSRNEISQYLQALASGIEKHGIPVRFFSIGEVPSIDAVACWGWRRALECRNSGFKGPILVVERGYLGDRLSTWTSLGWDGLNGRARFNGIHDPDRFDRHFAANLKPWRRESKGYALIAGQVKGDASLLNVDILQWYKDTAVSLWKQGWDVVFRQHPREVDRGRPQPSVPFARYQDGTLQEALSGAGLVVTYNSNTGVDAIMAGAPVYAADVGSMVYGLASRDFNPLTPRREDRLNEIANVQWMMGEMSSGKAWEIVKQAM